MCHLKSFDALELMMRLSISNSGQFCSTRAGRCLFYTNFQKKIAFSNRNTFFFRVCEVMKAAAIKAQNRIKLTYGQTKAKIKSAVEGNNCRFSCFSWVLLIICLYIVQPAAYNWATVLGIV